MASTDRPGWRGGPMRETVRSIAAEYQHGERIRLRNCPDLGTIAEVRCLGGRIQYRADWDHTPQDAAWYDEDEIQLFAEDGDG